MSTGGLLVLPLCVVGALDTAGRLVLLARAKVVGGAVFLFVVNGVMFRDGSSFTEGDRAGGQADGAGV